MDNLYKKKEDLLKRIKELKSVGVAFSGGVDSSLLLYLSSRVLKDKAEAFIAVSPLNQRSELDFAKDFCKKHNIKLNIIEIPDVLSFIEDNPIDRCYICKKHIMTKIIKAAKDKGLEHVIEGSNLDDDGDFRPGMKAIEELGILSPLKEALLTKDEIRALSKEENLTTFCKPSSPCLATRFMTGEKLTTKKLSLVEKSEEYLHSLGFLDVRVRYHNEIARIEMQREDIKKATEEKTAEKISKHLKDLGFRFVTIDLSGYKTGNMNKK
ncbi:MAG: ATP-dependent sacrificial sulfur transferase LarE [Clostridia bacterium]|nr:ATP-dependent sacrificial sulfur transferase LarE [Clostridia bacterium]